jgi:hypothetical protein
VSDSTQGKAIIDPPVERGGSEKTAMRLIRPQFDAGAEATAWVDAWLAADAPNAVARFRRPVGLQGEE